MASLFNTNLETVEYAGIGNNKATITFSNSVFRKVDNGKNQIEDNARMLVQSASIQFQRNISKTHFINSGAAILVGRGQGTLQLQGLFGSAADIKALCGSPDKPCSMGQTITLEAGVLRKCDRDGDNKLTGGASETLGHKLTLHDCVCTGLSIVTTVQQDGSLYQQASATFLVSDMTAEDLS